MDENMFDLGLDVAMISAELPDPVITLSGADSYTVQDTADYPLLALNVYGKSTQGYASSGGTPLGKNLLQILPTYNLEHKGVTVASKVDNNGLWCIEIKGTSPSDYIDFRPFGGSSATKSLNLPEGDYILSGVQPNSGVRLVALCKDDQAPKIDTGRGVTFTQNSTNDHYYIRLDVIQSGEINTVVYPMLRSASITDDTYEPYYSNPNPDCPVDVVSVGDDSAVNIVSHGKNLFDFTAWKNGITAISNGTAEYSENSIKLTATAADCYTNGANCDIPVKPNTTYVLSWVSDNQNQGITYVFLNGKVESELITSNNSWPSKRLTFTSKSDTTFIRVRFGVSHAGNSITYSNIQLEKGNVKTEYEPFKGYNTAAITSGLPLCSVGDVRDELIYNADGTGKIIKRIAMITLDGSNDEEYSMGATTNVYVGINTRLPLPVKLTTAIKSNVTDKVNNKQATTDSFAIHCGRAVNLLFGIDMNVTTIEDVRTWLATHPTTIIYPLAEPQEIELSAAEMAELMQLQSYEGTTNIYNHEQTEMLVKVLRREFDMKYIEWLKESQTWTCPKAGKWKAICVGGGASGGLYDTTENAVKLTPTTAGGTTSFGSIVSADGAPSTKDSTMRGYSSVKSATSGYGGYTGTSYGGVPMVGGNSATSALAAGGTGNSAVMTFENPTAAVGYGAGGGAVSLKEAISPIAGRAGAIESTIVDLEEGQTILCTIGKGGQTTDPATMGSGADGVIVVQYLGY